jgi:hypothetical protein
VSVENARVPRLRAADRNGGIVTFNIWFNDDLSGREHPIVLDIHNRAVSSQRGWDSWYFSPFEALRLADLLDRAARAAAAKAPQLIGAFANPDIRNGKPVDWLTVDVAPAAYLRTKEPRVRLTFDDPLTREAPDAATLWLTPSTSTQMAVRLREATGP